MPAEFYYDDRVSAQYPQRAIEIIRGDWGNLAKASIAGLWNGAQPPQTLVLPGATAFLMMGTTAELQEGLWDAYNQGIRWISTPNDTVAVWYVRRKAGWETNTVGSIAPAGRYWGAIKPYDLNWRQLIDPQTGVGTDIALQMLADHHLPAVKGQTGWF